MGSPPARVVSTYFGGEKVSALLGLAHVDVAAVADPVGTAMPAASAAVPATVSRRTGVSRRDSNDMRNLRCGGRVIRLPVSTYLCRFLPLPSVDSPGRHPRASSGGAPLGSATP